jgi:hypothetical protein
MRLFLLKRCGMRHSRVRTLSVSRSGQAMLETALALPLLLLVVLNAINFGYFFYALINIAEAPRAGAQWSIMGSASASHVQPPPAGSSSTPTSVSYLVLQDLAGLPSGSSSEVQVCSQANGVSGSGVNQVSVCTQYGGSKTSTPDKDPEAPLVVLNRVDVWYTFTPLINASAWVGVWPPPAQIHRFVEMRAVN